MLREKCGLLLLLREKHEPFPLTHVKCQKLLM